jgi:hypothetical protein
MLAGPYPKRSDMALYMTMIDRLGTSGILAILLQFDKPIPQEILLVIIFDLTYFIYSAHAQCTAIHLSLHTKQVI